MANLDALARQASLVLSRDGSEFASSGGDVTVTGAAATFASQPEEISWAVYSYDTAADALANAIQLGYTAAPGQQVWIGLADFCELRWRYFELTTPATSIDLGGADCITSPGGHCFVAVIVMDGSGLTLDSLSLELADPPCPLTSVITYGVEGENEWLDGLVLASNGELIGMGVCDAGLSVIRLEPSGSIIWSKVLLDPTESTLYPTNLVLSDNGDIVIGLTYRYGDVWDLAASAIRLSADGALLWARAYVFGPDADQWVAAAGADTLLFGTSRNDPDPRRNFIMRIGPDGVIQWCKESGEDSVAAAIASGSSIYVSGTRAFDKSFIAKLAGDSTPEVVKDWWGRGFYGSLAPGGSGEIVLGQVSSFDELNRYQILRFDSGCGLLNQIGYEVASDLDLLTGPLVIDAEGNLVVTVNMVGEFPSVGRQLGVVRMSPTGTLLSDHRLIHPYRGGQLVALGEGQYVVCGSRWATGTPDCSTSGGTAFTPTVVPANSTLTLTDYSPVELSYAPEVADYSVASADHNDLEALLAFFDYD